MKDEIKPQGGLMQYLHGKNDAKPLDTSREGLIKALKEAFENIPEHDPHITMDAHFLLAVSDEMFTSYYNDTSGNITFQCGSKTLEAINERAKQLGL